MRSIARDEHLYGDTKRRARGPRRSLNLRDSQLSAAEQALGQARIDTQHWRDKYAELDKSIQAKTTRVVSSKIFMFGTWKLLRPNLEPAGGL